MQQYPSPNAAPADGAGGNYFNPSPPNPDELQLTAQLSRGLAPMMNNVQGGGMADPRGPGHGHDGGNHYEQDQAHAGHNQQSHAPVDQMGGQYTAADGSMVPRKRTKVSRACDECRRKKIRCDAKDEASDEQCTNCKRVGTRCQFSRVPMKRGPSKGYIKELADRLNTLEGAMQAGEVPYLAQNDVPRRPSAEYTTDDNPPLSKRSYSTYSNSNEFGSPFQTTRSLGAWNAAEGPRHAPVAPGYSPQNTSFRDPNYSPNGLQPSPIWRSAPEQHQQGSFDSMAQGTSAITSTSEWDESVIDSYYAIIHPLYPMLPSAREKIKTMVATVSPILRDAFYEALSAALRSFLSVDRQPSGSQSIEKASQLLATFQSRCPAPRPFTTDLIYLQCMLLMAIENGNIAPNPLQPHQGPFPAIWLGSAVALAYSMNIHLRTELSKSADIDSEEKIARRLWWIIFAMDRFNSSGSSIPHLIPDQGLSMRSEDLALLGDTVYQTMRLCIILGQETFARLESAQYTDVAPAMSMYGQLIRGSLERVRESLPDSLFADVNTPIFHLAFWYLRTIEQLVYRDAEAVDLLTPALKLLDELKKNPGLICPLNHHFIVLAALTLLELREHATTKDKAEIGLKSLLEDRIAPSTWTAAVRELVSSKIRGVTGVVASTSEGKHASTADQNLQQLADLATATGESRDLTGEERKEGDSAAGSQVTRFKNLHDILKNGYLRALGGDAAR